MLYVYTGYVCIFYVFRLADGMAVTPLVRVSRGAHQSDAFKEESPMETLIHRTFLKASDSYKQQILCLDDQTRPGIIYSTPCNY